MGSQRIKGITIEIGGDTVGLEKALSDVNKKSIGLQKELKDVERLLKFDPGNVEALAQKQRILTQQIELTSNKLNQLKQAEAEVQKQFEKGKISEEQYRSFRREIHFTEASLGKLRTSLSKVNDNSSIRDIHTDAEQAGESIKGLGGEIAGVIGGLAAGGGIAGVLEKALETSTTNTKIDISFNVPEESKAIVKKAIKDVQAYGVDAEAALEGVRRQWALNKDASASANAAIIKSAGAISEAFDGIDFTELIQESHEMAKEMGMSQEDALGLTNALLKVGFPPDQLDTIAEYGAQLKRAGYNAEEIQAIMAAGVDSGTWNIDNLLDGLKEGRVRLAQFGQSVPKATAQLLEGTKISTDQLQKWGKAIAEGGKGGQLAMQEVGQALSNVKDKTTQNALGVQLFGTMWEDQGSNILETLGGMKSNLATAKENQQALNDTTKQMDENPQVRLNKAIADMNTALAPLLTQVAEFVGKIADWAAQNPTLAATITAIVTVLGILIGLALALTPVILAVTGAFAAAEIALLPIILTVMAVVAAIAAVIAIGVLLYKNWDTIKEKVGNLINHLGPFKGLLLGLTGPIGMVIGAGVSLYKNWDKIMDSARKLKNTVANLFKGIKWELPKLKLPHFSISGKLDLNPKGGISVPKINVDWYKNGGLFPANSPRLIGIGDHPTAQEAALPLTKDVFRSIASGISEFINVGGNQGIVIQNMTVRSDDDIKKLARELFILEKRDARSKGVVRR
ncbi:hypothetical protein CN692_24225 [Bacillus sp. AFS002410]|uniref:phage tail tape measure protein n=1 Tax=Bacillus sp. AFS002410 TaxID=2033481 RepID=UPI000BEF6515|nr:phage tail tape measure protein [Bacillus sp. AFS002410]PEJ48217.1 hypothetical protein CN692_24225 [Bacillus sp. AFS002410]